MPEDQGVNGDFWNEEAAILLTKLGWNKVGDSNIDVENEDGEQHGLDAMFVFNDSQRNSTQKQGVFVEAKRYKTTSFKTTSLPSWINIIDKKLTKLKNSGVFQTTYPSIGKTLIQNGLIVIWFSDLKEYESFKLDLMGKLPKIKASPKSNTITPNRIYILHNEQILHLCSLITTIEKINDSNKKHKLNFHYPASEYFNTAVTQSQILKVEYMFSKFILAESVVRTIENKFVFYYGELTIQSFERLKSFLLSISFIQRKQPLTIFKYLRDDNFRKIEPDIKRLFNDVGVKVQIEEMEIFADLPTFLKIK